MRCLRFRAVESIGWMDAKYAYRYAAKAQCLLLLLYWVALQPLSTQVARPLPSCLWTVRQGFLSAPPEAAVPRFSAAPPRAVLSALVQPPVVMGSLSLRALSPGPALPGAGRLHSPAASDESSDGGAGSRGGAPGGRGGARGLIEPRVKSLLPGCQRGL